MANISELQAALDVFYKRRFEQEQRLHSSFEAIRDNVVHAHAHFGNWLKEVSSTLRWSDKPEVLTISVDGIHHQLQTKRLVIGFAQRSMEIIPAVDDDLNLSFRLEGLTGAPYEVYRVGSGWGLERGDTQVPFNAGTLIELMIADIP